jgi:hypothetical protein
MDDKDVRIAELERIIAEIGKTANTAMEEAHSMVGARILMDIRWIQKLVDRAQGKPDD